jgi:hypothetical protein
MPFEEAAAMDNPGRTILMTTTIKIKAVICFSF